LFGTLFRLLGADAVIFPHFAGRFAYSRSTCAQVVHRGQVPLGAFAATLPVPAGGLQLEAIGTALDFYGSDVMLLIGGSLLLEADKVHERAARFVAEVATATSASEEMRTSSV
jgi:ribulose-bisphosphate carboxylase large chain